MKLASLFEPKRHRAPTMRAELDAVRAGQKPIAMETWPAGSLDDDHAAMLRLARGLELVARRERGLDIVYALRDSTEAWRIEALHALWRTVPALGWSDGAEALESHLLGYTPAQIERWLAARRHERLGWRGVTIYALLSRATRRSVVESGRFPRERATVFACDGTHVIKRRPPAWVAKRGLVIARTAVATLPLPPGRGWLRSRELELAELAPIERIELLTARGWR